VLVNKECLTSRYSNYSLFIINC